MVKLVKVLREIKDMQGPRLLHLCTVKGKGFPEAENNPKAWHAPGKFDPDTGEKLKKKSPDAPPLWQDVFGDTLVELADTNENVMGITAAMISGTSLGKMYKKYPKRSFDVGISEGHAVTFAGGLAAAGNTVPSRGFPSLSASTAPESWARTESPTTGCSTWPTCAAYRG